MDLTITLDDLATIVVTKPAFKAGVAEEVKNHKIQLEKEIMILKEQLEQLKVAVATQTVAIKTEFDQVKAKFESQGSEIGNLKKAVAALEVKIGEFESLDASAELKAINDSLAAIDAISESDVPPADTTPPAIPLSLVATNTTAVGTDLAWNSDPDVAMYNVFQDGIKVGSATVSAFSVTGLTSATAYSFTVSAKDAAGNESSQSDALAVTTL